MRFILRTLEHQAKLENREPLTDDLNDYAVVIDGPVVGRIYQYPHGPSKGKWGWFLQSPAGATCVYRKLGSAIMVVKAAEDRLRCDGADALNRAMKRGVLVQRSMSPQLIIIGGICAEDSAQVCFTEHDHVVQALPADRANEPLNLSVLPG